MEDEMAYYYEWTTLLERPTVGLLRMRYAALSGMILFFVFSVLALVFSFEAMLPLMTISVLAWAIFGSAAAKVRRETHKMYRG